MSLFKFGSQLKIVKTAAVMEDVLTPEASLPVTSKIIEAKNPDFLYYRARAISAGDFGPMQKDGTRGFNFNGNKDYFPRKELESAYQTFVGRNIFLDHNSESSLYSVGKIVDALPIDDKETGEFYIELVGKIDRKLHPEICRKIETGELNSTSMGCSVDESICSICGHVLHSDADEKCEHMGMNLGKEFPAEVDFPEYNIKKGDIIPCFSINKGIVFNEDSIVGVPADPTAVIKTVLSNMKHQMSKKASLSKEEQLDLAAQMDNIFNKLDDATKTQLKADFCGICPPVEKESSMADTNVIPNEETKKILNKISAYEMEQLESYVAHKTKKASEEKAIVADSAAKEESFLSKIVAKVKEALTDKEHTLTARFIEDKNNILDSTWSVDEDDKTVLYASLKDIWGSKYETLSFDDQIWATSEDYAKEVLARYTQGGVEKLANDWDLKLEKTADGKNWPTQPKFEMPGQEDSSGPAGKRNNKWIKIVYKIKKPEGSFFKPGSDSSNDWKPEDIKKAAAGPELGPDGKKVTPTTGLSNKKHDYPTQPKFEMPGQEAGQKGPKAPESKDVKTEYKLDMPGQEKGQTGPAGKKPMSVKTDYSEPKPEAVGKEQKTTPKNPEEKKHEKSEKEVKTDYVAAGTEAMEKENKADKKEDKKSSLNWSTLSPEAQTFIKTASKKYIASGMTNAEAVAKAHSEFTAQENDMKKQAATAGDKPEESVDGSTQTDGKKTMGDKVEESVQGTTVPSGDKPSASPETSVKDDKEHKTPDLTKKPEESVDGTTLPPQGKKDEESAEKTTHPDGKKEMGDKADSAVKEAAKTMGDKPEEAVQDKPELSKKTMGDKAEQSAQGETEPAGTDPKKAIDEAVKKEAATAEPMPEDKPAIPEEIKVEEKPALPSDAPVMPEAEKSAFDTVEKPLEIGEGYSAMKDKATNEVVISKDGKEVKRLPDGFGADMAAVLPLLKAVLGLPAAEAPKPEMGMPAPMEQKMEEPKPELPEAHEDEMEKLELKESSLKTKEAELAQKEAAIQAKEAAIKAEENAKKFASVVTARAERCKKIVATLVEKDALQMDKEVFESERQIGTNFLDAQKKAFEHAITSKQKELMAMDDNALLATEKVVADLKAPTTPVNTKKASRIFVSPSFNEELSEDEYLKKIFATFGTKNRPQ